MPVEKGNKVKVDYKGTLEDGTVFDSSETHGKPLEFEAGAGQVIPGFDNAILGKEKGDEVEVKLNPDQAYGEPQDKMIQEIPKNQLPKDNEPKEGMMLSVGLPNGQQIPAKITKITDDKVTIDMNHPLAGKILNFWIKVVDY